MSDVKHTPGPWFFNPDHTTWIDARGCCERGSMHVADVRGWGHLTGHGHGAHGMPHDEARAIQDANARLIATAPDLLVALVGLLDLFRSIDGFDCWEGSQPITLADAAIAKATGSP